MPKINLCFSGWVRGADVTKATRDTDTGTESVDVSDMPAEELARKLKAGELFISLGDHLYDADDNEIEMFDFTASEV